MTIQSCVAALQDVIDNLPDEEKHRIAGAWKTVKLILEAK